MGITINGKSYNVSGGNITINGDSVIIDGQTIESGLSGIVRVEVTGDLASLDCTTAVIHGKKKSRYYSPTQMEFFILLLITSI